jgi:hypothetical protein
MAATAVEQRRFGIIMTAGGHLHNNNSSSASRTDTEEVGMWINLVDDGDEVCAARAGGLATAPAATRPARP